MVCFGRHAMSNSLVFGGHHWSPRCETSPLFSFTTVSQAGKDDPTPPKRYNCCHDSDEQRSLPVRCNNRVDSVSLTSKFQITEDPISSYLSCFHDSGNSLGV
ncbi:hypothetical protein BHM03_00005527 [Ensete ventricosum]|nr:hypothetical protein BHM03_00005527 [Ensete ventricosum]